MTPQRSATRSAAPDAARTDAPAPADPGAAARRAQAAELFALLAGLPEDSPERDRLRLRLIEMHVPMVRYFARRYAGGPEPLEDLVQAGCIGLVKAVDRFDPDRGVEFSSFAAPTILGEIRRYFRDCSHGLHVYRSLGERVLEVRRVSADLIQQLGRHPTVAEIADRVDRSEELVKEALLCSSAARPDSLHQPMGADSTLGDTLGRVDPAIGAVELHESLAAALAVLTPREQEILRLRYFGDMTQVQIAGRIGVSQMHVSRLLGRALGRLRRELAA
jgi:RNA polymerase sigma-B factor